MQYEKLNKENFDAIVTGQLTHYALWLEDELDSIIINYFGVKKSRRDEFKRIILLRNGLTFQDKLEIVRGMIPLLGEVGESCNLKQILKDVEEFKSWRNAMAHGQDVSDDEWAGKLKICVTTRSGTEKIIEITPDSHSKRMDDTEVLLVKLKAAREALKSM